MKGESAIDREEWVQDLAAEFMPVAATQENRPLESWDFAASSDIVSRAFTLAEEFKQRCDRRMKAAKQQDE